ncbi:Abnormal cell lineage protein 44 [Physocladia obscura]|uniref:Abnormal cell lineage protein 44 n=1 Tax=Physocladia obscura TaxID=109957 RepID=A0AAD5XGJ1_9FUNG|nr:Abnormal cell lineage protein 44 [Physocladia obscura]
MTASLATNKDQHCLLGVPPELDQCGFVSASESAAYCMSAAGVNDQCCTFPPGVQFATLNAADGNYYLPGATTVSSKTVLSIGVIAGIAVGGVAVVALLVGAFFFIWRRRRAQAQPEFKYEPKPLYDSPSSNNYNKNSNNNNNNNNNYNYRANDQPIYPPPQQQLQQLQPLPGSRPYPGTGSLPRPQQQPIYQNNSNPNPATAAANAFAQQQTSAMSAKEAANGGDIMRIIHPYDAQLEDELQLVEGDDLIVLKKFDDGWAQGLNPLTGKQGAFPLVCVISLAELNSQKAASQKKNASGGRISKRMSSIVDFTPAKASSPLPKKDINKVQKKGSALRVLFAYTAAQEDELDLIVGNDVLLVKSFDGGCQT